jgi:hypothetical protein
LSYSLLTFVCLMREWKYSLWWRRKRPSSLGEFCWTSSTLHQNLCSHWCLGCTSLSLSHSRWKRSVCPLTIHMKNCKWYFVTFWMSVYFHDF